MDHKAVMSPRGMKISEDDQPVGDDNRLEAEIAARRAAEDELAALRAEKRQIEERLINAHRTLAYGLGKALIDARTLGGMAALPRRLRRLRLKQKAKRRERVPDTAPRGIADRLQLVDPALERLHTAGAEAAANWVRAQSNAPDAQARALTEIAIAISDGEPQTALALANEAAGLAPGEARLVPLFARLAAAGEVFKSPTAAEIDLAATEFELETTARRLFCVAADGDAANIRLVDALHGLRSRGIDACLAVTGSPDAVAAMVEHAGRDDSGAALVALGAPLPIRWPALLGWAEALILPGGLPHFGEPAMLRRQAVAQQVPVVAAMQAYSDADTGVTALPETGDWAGILANLLDANN